MMLRVALVLCAAAAIGVGISGLRQTHRCGQAKQAIDAVVFQRTLHRAAPDPHELAAAQARLVADCRDRTEIARYATVEGTVGLTQPATSLARTVTRLEPDNRFGWLALALVLGGDHPLAAAAARRRAHALDPRGVPLASTG
jgi:hypothetical protein